MPPEVRVATQEDVPRIVEVIVAAYGLDEKPQKRQYQVGLVHSEYPHFLVLEDEGRVVSVLRLRPDRLQIGTASIIKGELGHVGTDPALQGRGYATALMNGAIDFMFDSGYHCTRLGGLMHFYSRSGYEPFIRRYVEFPVRPEGIKGLSWDDMYGMGPELESRVRAYNPSHDHARVHTLRREFNEGRSGCQVMAEEPGPPPEAGPDPDGLDFVYEVDGVVQGYLRGHVGPVAAGDPPSHNIDDLAISYDHPEAAEALVKRVLREARSDEPVVVTARLPYEEWLFEALTAGNIYFNVVEWRTAVDGNMMRVIDLQALFGELAAELTARLQATPMPAWEGSIEFLLPGVGGSFNLEDGRINANPNRIPDASIETSHASLLKWVFGISGFAEHPLYRDESIVPEARQVLAGLFPRTACCSGPWG
jgi:predicted N-acetyltransferase YhbS